MPERTRCWEPGQVRVSNVDKYIHRWINASICPLFIHSGRTYLLFVPDVVYLVPGALYTSVPACWSSWCAHCKASATFNYAVTDITCLGQMECRQGTCSLPILFPIQQCHVASEVGKTKHVIQDMLYQDTHANTWPRYDQPDFVSAHEKCLIIIHSALYMNEWCLEILCGCMEKHLYNLTHGWMLARPLLILCHSDSTNSHQRIVVHQTHLTIVAGMHSRHAEGTISIVGNRRVSGWICNEALFTSYWLVCLVWNMLLSCAKASIMGRTSSPWQRRARLDQPFIFNDLQPWAVRQSYKSIHTWSDELRRKRQARAAQMSFSIFKCSKSCNISLAVALHSDATFCSATTWMDHNA